jgi:hypothetical protein
MRLYVLTQLWLKKTVPAKDMLRTVPAKDMLRTVPAKDMLRCYL